MYRVRLLLQYSQNTPIIIIRTADLRESSIKMTRKQRLPKCFARAGRVLQPKEFVVSAYPDSPFYDQMHVEKHLEMEVIGRSSNGIITVLLVPPSNLKK